MIRKIHSSQIILEVIHALGCAKQEVLATDNNEGVTKNEEYVQALKKIQERGVLFKREQFSKNKNSYSKLPYLRMILIDGTLLFFAIPGLNDHTFFSTDEKELVQAYKDYFFSINR